MTLDAWVVLAVVAAAVAVMVADRLAPAGAMTAALVVLLAFGIVDPGTGLAGFSNPATIAIAALFVLARAVTRTRALGGVVGRALGTATRERRALARLVVPVAAVSAFLNNTPVVATLVPQVERWARRHGRSPSRFLLPLSYAAILGGTLTLMGTATNLVVSGALDERGLPPFGFFELTPVALPIVAIGLGVLVLAAPRLLPDRVGVADLAGTAREFVIEMRVRDGGPLAGRRVEQAGLRSLHGVFLVEIERHGQVIAPVAPDLVLEEGDRLRFAGEVTQVVDLHDIAGLEPAAREHVVEIDARRASYFEAVIGPSSPLVGTTLKEAEFRSRYQAAVLAIHRSGQRVRGKLGEVRLRSGDTLLLVADPGFGRRWRGRPDFLIVARLDASEPSAREDRGPIVLGVLLAVIAVAATGTMPLVTAALVGAAAMVLIGALTPGEARDAVDLDVVVTIAAAFGVAAAVEGSGLAAAVADGLLAVVGDRPVATLATIVVATMVLTEFVTNSAAALLVLPLALDAAASAGLEPRRAAIAVAIAASASFLTPLGYQTNTMVFGPGGYRASDYLRLGLPLAVVVLVGLVWGLA